MTTSNTTRRHPRTLNEAFGPYQDRSPIFPPRGQRTRAAHLVDALLWLLGVVMFVAVIAAALLTEG